MKDGVIYRNYIIYSLLKLNYLLGDAPVHSYYVILMLEKSQIHRFENIAYGHTDIYNWPVKETIKCENKTEIRNLNCIQYWDMFVSNKTFNVINNEYVNFNNNLAKLQLNRNFSKLKEFILRILNEAKNKRLNKDTQTTRLTTLDTRNSSFK